MYMFPVEANTIYVCFSRKNNIINWNFAVLIHLIHQNQNCPFYSFLEYTPSAFPRFFMCNLNLVKESSVPHSLNFLCFISFVADLFPSGFNTDFPVFLLLQGTFENSMSMFDFFCCSRCLQHYLRTKVTIQLFVDNWYQYKEKSGFLLLSHMLFTSLNEMQYQIITSHMNKRGVSIYKVQPD